MRRVLGDKWVLVFVLMVALISTSSVQATDLNQEFIRLQTELQNRPHDSKLLKELALLYSHGLQWELAAQTYDKILAQNPKDTFALAERCVCYTEALNPQKAISSCEEFAKHNQGSALALDNLGLMYFRFQKYDQALKAFTKARKISPDSALILLHQAQVAMAYQEWSYALILLDETNALNPKPREKVLIAHAKSLIYDKLKLYDDAYEQIVIAYEGSQNPLFLTKVGKAFLKKHQTIVYFLVVALILWFCRYMGVRLNRFLKNED